MNIHFEAYSTLECIYAFINCENFTRLEIFLSFIYDMTHEGSVFEQNIENILPFLFSFEVSSDKFMPAYDVGTKVATIKRVWMPMISD